MSHIPVTFAHLAPRFQFVCMLYVLLLYLHLYLFYLLCYFYISTHFLLFMNVCLSYHRTHQHPRHALLHFPIICNFCLTIVFTGIISDVFAPLTLTTVHTCTLVYAYTPHISTLYTQIHVHLHIRASVHPYLVFHFPFPFYLLVHPYMPVDAHTCMHV